jgi:uncharacterized protein YheU (UPF0270 family)
VEIPYQRLPEDILTAVIEEFVTREGTEYGEREVSLADKVASVRKLLKRGEAVVVFDPESQTTSIQPRT